MLIPYFQYHNIIICDKVKKTVYLVRLKEIGTIHKFLKVAIGFNDGYTTVRVPLVQHG